MSDTSILFSGHGEVRALFRTFKWTDFPAGHPDEWPSALKTTVALILDSSLPMYIVWGQEERQIYNDAYIEIMGSKHPAGLARPIWETWPEIRGRLKPVLDKVWKGHPRFLTNIEFRLKRSERWEQTWFTFSASPIRNGDHTVGGIFITVLETTRQVLAERCQLAEKERLRRLFEQAPSFMAVLRGPDHIFELVNHACFKASGFRTLIGQSVRDAFPELEGQGYFELLDQVYKTAQPYVAHGLAMKLQQTPDGPLEKFYIDFVYQPIIEANGTVSGIFIEGNDVTAQYHSQLRLTRLNQKLSDKLLILKEAEQRQAFQLELADLLRSLSDPHDIFTKTSELLGRYLKVSRVLYGEHSTDQQKVIFHSNYTNGRVSEITGEFPTALFGPKIFATLENGKVWVCNTVKEDSRTLEHWPTYKSFHIHTIVAIPLNRHGGLIFSLFIHNNQPRQWQKEELRLLEDTADRIWTAIERTRAEQALRQADRRKDEFLAMLAHELRNPLAPISAAAHLLGKVKMDEERLKQTSTIISRQVQHLADLVDDLLDVSRVTRGLVTIDKSAQDFKAIISSAIEQVKPLIEFRHHQLDIIMPAESAYVYGDPKRLVQILTNLLNNAAKYTAEGGRIALDLKIKSKRLIVTVTDNGMGIAPPFQPHIFDLFTQAERTPDRSQGGLGLGLALVKSLTELHGGTVSCFSEGQGKGSRFTLSLPQWFEEEAHIAPQKDKLSFKRPGQGLTIMIVDDNVDAAQLLALFIKELGHEVCIEHSSQKALEQSRLIQPDAFLLDIGLPNLDGIQLAKRLKSQPETNTATLIAITGYGQENDRKKALKAGFEYYFVKPVEIEELAALLESISASMMNRLQHDRPSIAY